MFAFDVRMIFDVGKDMQSSPDARLCEILSHRIDPTALGASNHPGETVDHAQRLFNPSYCSNDRNNLASTQPRVQNR
jgi:hypothetical protein